MADRLFWVARDEEIKRAETTDAYFLYTVEALRKSRIDPRVVMEVYARTVPYADNWGVVTGIYEVAKLLEGLPLDVWAMREGDVFVTAPDSAIHEPVLQIEGSYRDFAVYENPLLGLLCSSTSVSTKAARIRLAAGKKLLFSFGTRRVHPALAPLVERSTYLAGFDSVSNVLGARLMHKTAVGTMPHAFVQCFGDQQAAWKAFDRAMPASVPRIALVDTFFDEKAEAVMALETLGRRLDGVRLDTPSSRRGRWREIIEEVRWELTVRGGSQVKIYVSGGLDEHDIRQVYDLVDGFGVGTSVSNPPVVDFSAKIVEVDAGRKTVYRAKRGDLSGRKQVYRDERTFDDLVTLATRPSPPKRRAMLAPLLERGRIVRSFESLGHVRERVLRELSRLVQGRPVLRWA